jgi:CheY-like chemotaxis protein
MHSYPPPQLRILVLDEDDSFRGMLTGFLRSQGHIVEPASCAKDALAIFQPGKFQLIITDLALPETTGDMFTAAIKAASPDQPIIMLTAYGVSSSRHPMQQVDYLLSKPFPLKELQQAIVAATAPNSLSLDGSAHLISQSSARPRQQNQCHRGLSMFSSRKIPCL